MNDSSVKNDVKFIVRISLSHTQRPTCSTQSPAMYDSPVYYKTVDFSYENKKDFYRKINKMLIGNDT